MANSLRVIYNNLIDISGNTLVASSTASSSMSVSNLSSGLKSLRWRSATTGGAVNPTKANLSIKFPSTYKVSALVVAFTNLGQLAKYRVRLCTGASAPTLGGTVDAPSVTIPGGTTVVYDSGASPTLFQSDGDMSWDESPTSVVGKFYGVIWLPSAISCDSLVLEIQDPDNANKYIEISKLVCGTYWSPTFNTSYGLSTTLKDLSTTERTEAGDLITNNGAQFNSLSFDLQYMNKEDKIAFNYITKSRGTKKPLFISLFPNNIADVNKESIYQIYGKLVQSPTISHPIFDMYSSQIEIEEI